MTPCGKWASARPQRRVDVIPFTGNGSVAGDRTLEFNSKESKFRANQNVEVVDAGNRRELVFNLAQDKLVHF